MSITESIARRVGDVDAALTSHGKILLAQARKPAYAWLGASEYAVSHLTELPAISQAAARGVQRSFTAGTPSVREVVQQYGEVYDGLAQRGELVADKLRSRITGAAEETAVVEPSVKPVPEPPAKKATTARKRTTTTRRRTTK